MTNNKIKTWFDALPPDRKRKVVVGGSLVLILLGVLVTVLATDDGQKPVTSSRKKKVEASILTGRDPQKVGMEQVTAENKRQQAELESLRRQMQMIANQQGGQHGVSPSAGAAVPFPYNNGQSQEVVALPGSVQESNAKGAKGSITSNGVSPIAAPDKLVQQALAADPAGIQKPRGKSNQPPTAGVNSDLPPPNIPGVRNNSDVYGPSNGEPTVGTTPDTPPPAPSKLKLHVFTPRQDSAANTQDAPAQSNVFTQGSNQNAGQKSSLASLARANVREPEYYLPMGAILSGTLMTGVDAPASGSAAKKDPFPALFRVKHEAILPNAGSLDLRECFIVASAYSDLSSERVYMRAEGLSCQRSDGAVIEASLDAYASGGDGKAGIRGTVVEKTGQLIGRSLLAGFVAGIGKGFKPTQATTVDLNAANGTTSTFQFPDPSYVMGNGLLSGGASAAERIATIYEDLAKQIVPVIEVHAGIPVDFILTRGTTLRFKRVGENTGQRVATNNTQQKPSSNAGNLSTSITGSAGAPFSITAGKGTSTPAPIPVTPPTTITSTK